MLSRYALLLLPLICFPLTLFADTVVVASGERLGGKIVHKGKDTLTLQTDYAGEIRVQWSKIVAIATDEPVNIQVGDEDRLRKLTLAESGTEGIVAIPADNAEEAAETIPLSSIRYINPNPEETHDGITYKGRATLAFSSMRGNSSNSAAHAETAFNARARDYRYDLNAQGNRTEDRDVVTNSNWLVGGNYDRYLNPRRFVYGRASAERDRFKDIDDRYVVGGGYGWQLLDSERTQLSLRSGVDYVTVDRESSGIENYPALGWGIKFSHRPKGYSVEMFHEQEGYLRMNSEGEVTLRTRSGLRVPLLDHLTTTAQINADWERRPAPGRKATDSTLLFGLGYEW